MASERRLTTIVADVFGGNQMEDGGDRRPDLLLLNRYLSRFLLVEFKRGSATLDWDHKIQAERYWSKLKSFADPLDIIVLGGKRRPEMGRVHENGRIQLVTYTELISRASSELEWLLGELKRDARAGITPLE